MARRAATALILVICLSTFQVAAAAPTLPKITRIFLSGGLNSILGMNLASGLGFGLGSGTTLTLGATWTEILGLEPFAAYDIATSTGSGWNLSMTASHGGFGGDYRVDRLPEITVTRGGRIAGPLYYGLDAGVGYYLVRPNPVSGIRGTLGAQVATSPISVSTFLSVSGSTGYRQNVYAGSQVHSAWWYSVQVSVIPSPVFSTAFTYFRQDPKGITPLLFDNIDQKNEIMGTVSFRFGPAVAYQHSQTYSYVSQSISARVYTVNLSFGQAQSVGMSWDDVPQKISAYYSSPNLGTVSLSWEVPKKLFLIGFSR